jgi:hypothetical protein
VLLKKFPACSTYFFVSRCENQLLGFKTEL